MRQRFTSRFAPASALLLVLVGCGGGGDSSSPTTAGPIVSTTPTPTPTPTPVSSLIGATPLFAQGTGEDFLFVCDVLDEDLEPTLIQPQTGGVLVFEDTTQRYTVDFGDFDRQFGPEDIFMPSEGQDALRLYQNLSDNRDTRFSLDIAAPLSIFGFRQETGVPLENVESFRLTEQADGVTVGSFTGATRELTCVYGLGFMSGQLPADDQISFDVAGNFGLDSLVKWSATFDPESSEISFQAVTGSQQPVGGTGSSNSGGLTLVTILSAAFSGSATVDPETGRFEGTITELDDFEDPDISSDVLKGSDFAVNEGSFSGTFLGSEGDVFVFSYNIIATIAGSDSGSERVFNGVVLATSKSN